MSRLSAACQGEGNHLYSLDAEECVCDYLCAFPRIRKRVLIDERERERERESSRHQRLLR